MPTLEERMNQKRKNAMKASDRQIADYIWNLIEEELESVQEIRLGKYAIETYKIKLE